MFGCTRTLRNWSAEGRGSKVPTHVDLFDVKAMKLADRGLDREGMVLVALMSGGDYLPEGVPNCGVKVACEAARGGYGKSLCRLKVSDKAGIQAWKDSLIHELRTNEKKIFRTRHKALEIPEDFPNLEVLRFYTHPVVSQETKLDDIRANFNQKRDMHLDALREFTRETFDWDYRIGAIKFIRVLGEARLVSTILNQQEEGDLVKRILNRRTHFSTDASPELRLSYIPQELVPIDLSKEVDEDTSYGRSGLALNSDDEFEEAEAPEVSAKGASAKVFDPSKPDLTWVLEEVARKGVPKAVEEWEAAKSTKAAQKAAPKKTTGARAKKPSGMPSGALHQYVRVSKLASQEAVTKKAEKDPKPTQPSPSKSRSPRRLRVPSPLEPSKPPTLSIPASPVRQRNPWTLASSQETPRTPKRTGGDVQQAILISSSPVGPGSPPTSPSPLRRRPPVSSQELPAPRREIPTKTSAQGVRTERNVRTAKNKTSRPPSSSQDTKLKQTSLDRFTRRVDKEKTGVGIILSQTTTSSQTAVPPSSITQKASSPHIDSDSDDDLLPLSSLLSTTHPTSPSKRRQNTPLATTRSSSPSPARKKKLLIPRTSAVGFFKEVEVDAKERDELLEKEAAILQRKTGRSGVTRWSDVTFVDLTGDD